MSSPSEFDRITRAWLVDGPTELADRVLGDALADVHRTRQQRRPVTARRFAHMSTQARLGLAIAAAVVVIVGGGVLLRAGDQQPVGASPAATASPTAVAPAPAASVGPATGPRVTCNDKGCYGENLSGLRAGALSIEVVGRTPDDVLWDLFSIDPGHTWSEVAAVVIERQQIVAAGGRAGSGLSWTTHWAAVDTRPSAPVATLGRLQTAGTYFVICVSTSGPSTDTGVFVVGPIKVAP